MKILLNHITNTYNYGSMMMAENVITYLKQYLGKDEIEFYTDCKTEQDISRLKQATKYEKIYKDTIICKNAKGKIGILKNILLNGIYNKKASRYYDLIIVLGGDDFSEIYIKSWIGKILATKEILDLKKLNSRKNVILLGQTVGPYTGIRKKIAKKVFSKIKLYTRDDINLETMKKEYGINAIPSRDLAFLNLARQDEEIKRKKEILNKYGLIEEEYITIVGTQLIDKYCSDTETFVKQFINIIKAVQSIYKGKKMLWLSHVTTEPYRYSDNYLLKLINDCDDFADKNMTIVKEPILPVDARILLGSGYLTITCRMHAAVSTFQMIKPAICLSYSPKYRGVIADGLDMDELVIEAKNDKLWQTEIVDVVIDKVQYVEKNREDIINKIHKNVNRCKTAAEETLKEISKDLLGSANSESK